MPADYWKQQVWNLPAAVLAAAECNKCNAADVALAAGSRDQSAMRHGPCQELVVSGAVYCAPHEAVAAAHAAVAAAPAADGYEQAGATQAVEIDGGAVQMSDAEGCSCVLGQAMEQIDQRDCWGFGCYHSVSLISRPVAAGAGPVVHKGYGAPVGVTASAALEWLKAVAILCLWDCHETVLVIQRLHGTADQTSEPAVCVNSIEMQKSFTTASPVGLSCLPATRRGCCCCCLPPPGHS